MSDPISRPFSEVAHDSTAGITLVQRCGLLGFCSKYKEAPASVRPCRGGLEIEAKRASR
jgi:hypothetical protein